VDFLAASLQEEEAAWTSLSTLEVVLASSTMALLVMWKVGSVLPTIAWKVSAVQWVVNERVIYLKAGARNDGTWHAQWYSSLWARQVTVWWFVSLEKVGFLFQPLMLSGHWMKERKVWKFEIFWCPQHPEEGT
jgi:hypothetical protein